jgi:hypothetical protein
VLPAERAGRQSCLALLQNCSHLLCRVPFTPLYLASPFQLQHVTSVFSKRQGKHRVDECWLCLATVAEQPKWLE